MVEVELVDVSWLLTVCEQESKVKLVELPLGHSLKQTLHPLWVVTHERVQDCPLQKRVKSKERSRDEENDDKVEGLIIGEAIIILLMDIEKG